MYYIKSFQAKRIESRLLFMLIALAKDAVYFYYLQLLHGSPVYVHALV